MMWGHACKLDGYGIYNFEDGQFSNISKFSSDIVEKIVVDEQNYLWAATNEGVKRIILKGNNVGNFRTYGIGDGLPTKETNTLFSDKQSIYVGTILVSVPYKV